MFTWFEFIFIELLNIYLNSRVERFGYMVASPKLV